MKKPIILAAILVILTACNQSAEKDTADYPNIIYVLADDLGYGDISTFNENSKIPTPHIDQLAEEGMKFTDAHTTSAVCTPTRYGILTGRYNWRSSLKNGVLWGHSRSLIPAGRATVASMLQEQGYHTAFIGKWHLGWNWAIKAPPANEEERWSTEILDTIDFSKPVTFGPNELGFSYSFGHVASLDMPPYVYVENGMATQIPEKETVDKGKYTWWRKGPTSDDFVHEEVTPVFFNKTMDHVREMAQKEEPFFIYLALPSPHTPILPTEEWLGKSGLNPYADFMMEIDDYMGQLIRTIKEAGIEQNTLVIFTSDNGCSPEADFDVLAAGGHHPSYIYRGHKADIFEGGHRVPFIAKWPAKIKQGAVSGEIISTADLMATCADITGYNLKDNEAEDSYSLLPLFEGVKLDEPLREATVLHSINGSFAIRQGDWKLIMCPGSGGWSFPRPNNTEVIETLPPIQLYNLQKDPAESNNLQADYPDKVEELKTLLARIILDGRSTPGEPQKNEDMDSWSQINWIQQD